MSESQEPTDNGNAVPPEGRETPQEPDVDAQRAAARQRAYRALRARMVTRQAAYDPTIAFILRRKMRRPKQDGR